MEHFRVILTQQKEGLTKDIDLLSADILKAEEVLETLKGKKTDANSLLRQITKKLEKL